MVEFSAVPSKFKLTGDVKVCKPFGNGHINGTYKVVTESNGKEYTYILQYINKNIFKEPEKVMANIEAVTDFLKKKGSKEREVLNFIKCENGTICYKDETNDYWRMYEFVDNALGVECPTAEEFYQCALAFGKFQSQLSDFPADSLYETIPDFHNTPKRYENFLKALQENKSGRADNAKEEIEFVHKYKDFYPLLMDLNKEGKLALRVSHNDTKSNNVLLDETTRKALCVIDLDTIMPGFSVIDFGDAIRFGGGTAAEDEKDLSKMELDLEKFKIYTKGFIEGCGGQLPKEEIMLLPEGAKMVTAECGMRFLTDYLDGDVYFKTDYPEHNLVRARTQFKLVREMDKYWDELKVMVNEFCEK